MPDITSPRQTTWHCEIIGEGAPLLFIHGWGVDHGIWRQQMKYFSRSYKVIGVDLPGHGKTAWQPLSLKDMAQDLLWLLKELNADPCYIVASSLGGLLALQMAALDASAVRALVFSGSQARFSRTPDYPYGLEVERLHKMAKQLDSDYPAIVNIFFRSLFTRRERATRRYKWIQRFRRDEGRPVQEALIGFLDILEQTDLRSVLENLTIPIQFINGTDDYICPQALYGQLRQHLPQARFDWMPDCGHFPFLVFPYDFNRMMEEFIRDQT